MSGEVTQRDSQEFEIVLENLNHAVKAILAIDPSKLDFGFPDLSDINPEGSYALEKIFKKFEIDALSIDGGGIGEIHFKAEKFGSRHRLLFETIAPYVVHGSFLEFVSTYEDTAIWRLIFHHGQVLHVNADISYKMPEETEKEFKSLQITVANLIPSDVRSTIAIVEEVFEWKNVSWDLQFANLMESKDQLLTLVFFFGDTVTSQEALEYNLDQVKRQINAERIKVSYHSAYVRSAA